LFQQQ